MLRLLPIVLCWTLALWPCPGLMAAPAGTQDDVAAGEAAWREERWDDASAAFAKAYARTGDPTYLYTRAQAERSAGRCAVAIDLYEEFVATEPSPQAELAARRYIAECRASLPAQTPVGPVDDDPTATTPAPLDATRTPTPTGMDDHDKPAQRWFRDPWGGAMVGVGAAAAATGGALVGLAYRGANRADAATDDRAFGQALQRAQVLERAGAVTLAIGGALLVAGVVRWAIVGTSARRNRMVATPGGWVVFGRLPGFTGRSAAATSRGIVRGPSRSPRPPR